jgi:hypothetical protein
MTDLLAVRQAQLLGYGGHHGGVAHVLRTARDHRWAPPPMTAVYLDDPLPDPLLDDEFELVMLGASDSDGPPPTAMRLYAESGGVDDDFRVMRCDTEQSYKALCGSLSPEFAEFQRRLAAVEKALAQHIADPNAHAKVQRAAEAMLGAAAKAHARMAGDAIAMELPPESDAKFRRWRQGDSICVTGCFPAPDGTVRYLTCATPAHVEAARLARYVDASGVHPAEVLGCAGMLCNLLGAGSLIPILCAGAPDALALDAAARPAGSTAPMVVRVQPETQPSALAILSLAERCEAGDEQAMEEWERLGDVAERGARVVVNAMNDAAAAVQS